MAEIVTRQGSSVRDVVIGYEKNDLVLKGLSLDVSAGELTVIISSNACGKSTLLRSLAHVLDVHSDVMELNGRSIANISQKALARRLGLLAQPSVAPGDVLVEDLVARGRHPYQSLLRQWSCGDDEAMARTMKDTGVTSLAGRRIGELSSGQRQRVWIAMALAQSTEVLLLDEPATYLDLNHQLEVLRLAERLQRVSMTVVAVLHDLYLAFRYVTHLVFTKNGEIVAQGVLHDVVMADPVERVFSAPCRITDDPETGSPLVISTR